MIAPITKNPSVDVVLSVLKNLRLSTDTKTVKFLSSLLKVAVLDFINLGKRYYIFLESDGKITISDQSVEATQVVKISLTLQTFHDIALGKISPLVAWLNEKVAIEGTPILNLRPFVYLVEQFNQEYRKQYPEEKLPQEITPISPQIEKKEIFPTNRMGKIARVFGIVKNIFPSKKSTAFVIPQSNVIHPPKQENPSKQENPPSLSPSISAFPLGEKKTSQKQEFKKEQSSVPKATEITVSPESKPKLQNELEIASHYPTSTKNSIPPSKNNPEAIFVPYWEDENVSVGADGTVHIEAVIVAENPKTANSTQSLSFPNMIKGKSLSELSDVIFEEDSPSINPNENRIATVSEQDVTSEANTEKVGLEDGVIEEIVYDTLDEHIILANHSHLPISPEIISSIPNDSTTSSSEGEETRPLYSRTNKNPIDPTPPIFTTEPSHYATENIHFIPPQSDEHISSESDEPQSDERISLTESVSDKHVGEPIHSHSVEVESDESIYSPESVGLQSDEHRDENVGLPKHSQPELHSPESDEHISSIEVQSDGRIGEHLYPFELESDEPLITEHSNQDFSHRFLAVLRNRESLSGQILQQSPYFKNVRNKSTDENDFESSTSKVLEIYGSDEIVGWVHQAILILSKYGCRFQNEASVKRLLEYGCKESNQVGRILIPEEIVWKTLEKLSGYERWKNPSLTLFSGQCNRLFDYERKISQEGSITDVRHIIQITNQLTNIAVASAGIIPFDVAKGSADVVNMALLYRYSNKPFWQDIYCLESAQIILEMMKIVPNEMVYFLKSFSPLYYKRPQLQISDLWANQKLPITVFSSAQIGLNCSHNFSATICTILADWLAGLVYLGASEYSREVVFQAEAKIAQNDGMVHHSPELFKVALALRQISQYLGYPFIWGNSCNISGWNIQTALDKVAGFTLNWMTGLFTGYAGMLGEDFSLEQLVLDDWLAGRLNQVNVGIEISPESLGLAQLKKWANSRPQKEIVASVADILGGNANATDLLGNIHREISRICNQGKPSIVISDEKSKELERLVKLRMKQLGD